MVCIYIDEDVLTMTCAQARWFNLGEEQLLLETLLLALASSEIEELLSVAGGESNAAACQNCVQN